MNRIKIAIVDDHKLFRRGMISILGYYPDLSVEIEADNGENLMMQLLKKKVNIILMDYSMHKLNGAETTILVKEMYPEIKVIGLSMFNDEGHILEMIEAGTDGYMLKDSEPDEIYKAIISVHENEMYYTQNVAKIVANAYKNQTKLNNVNNSVKGNIEITEREAHFLTLLCKELSHKEIAAILCVSERTIDGYRDRLCEKLKVKNKVGLVMYAVKNGLDQLDKQ